MNLLAKYNTLLQKKPLVTNIVSTATLFAVGDIVSQTIAPSEEHHNWETTLHNAIYGGLIFAPLVVPWYRFLQRRVRWPIPRSSSSSSSRSSSGRQRSDKLQMALDTASRVAVDQLVWAPCGVALYFFCMKTMDGDTVAASVAKVEQEWFATCVANWMVWPLVQSVNFAVVPVQGRVVVSGVCGVFWNAFLSARERFSRQ